MLDLTQLPEAVRSEGGISRRLFLAYGAALAAIPTLSLRAAGQPKSAIKFQSNPFTLGVASGDPTDTGVVLWTRLAPKPEEAAGGMRPENVEVRWELAGDEGMKKIVASGTETATPKLGHSVHVEAAGLKPGRSYFYRFHSGGATSPVGRTRTTPDPASTPDRLRFAVASCQHFESGLYTAYEHMAKDNLDLVFFLGDYIYESPGVDNRVRKHGGPAKSKLFTLEQFRNRHAQYRADPLLQAMHALCPWVVTWDDHEVENNYAGKRPGNDTDPKKPADIARFLEKRAHAYQAYYEMMPLRAQSVPAGSDMKLYRTVRFGQLATIPVLDTRQYRTNQPNGDTRAPLNDAALNSKNTLLGKTQLDWLKGVLGQSTATWNVLAQQVMMGMVGRTAGKEKHYSMDQWCGAASERMALMQWIADRKVPNVVVLTGDIHSNWVNNLHVDDRKPKTPVVATEFVATSISSKGNGPKEVKGLDALLAENPFVKYHNDQRGYIRCTVTPKTWRSDFQIVEEVTKPNGKVATGASFVIQAGKAGATKP